MCRDLRKRSNSSSSSAPSSCTAATVEPSWVSMEAAAVTGVAQQMILVRIYSCCAAEGEKIADLHASTYKRYSIHGEEEVEEEKARLKELKQAANGSDLFQT